ncbi:hypothetical protein GCM10027589_35040 [Actinocorallia lasiicapitis]
MGMSVVFGGAGVFGFSSGSIEEVGSDAGVSVSPDGRTIAVVVTWGDCDTVHKELKQSSDRVEFSIEIESDDGDCTLSATTGPVTAQLDEPLGSRPVIAADGRPYLSSRRPFPGMSGTP